LIRENIFSFPYGGKVLVETYVDNSEYSAELFDIFASVLCFSVGLRLSFGLGFVFLKLRPI